MTAGGGFKRLAFALAAVLLAGAGALAAISLMISPDTARRAVEAEIRAVSGLDPMLRGDVSVSLFPSGEVTFEDVALGDEHADGKALTADRLIARLRFLPLLAGKVQISDITLVRPTFNVTWRADGTSNWSAVAAALRPTQQHRVSFSEIRVKDGTILIHDESRHIDDKFTDAELSLAWPAMFRSFAATGHLAWRGEPVEVSLGISDFIAALDGNQSGIKLRLQGKPLNVAFEGQFSTRPTFKIEGSVAADSKSLRDAVMWTAGKRLPHGGFGRFALKAKTKVVGGAVALSAVNVELDGNSAEGVLTFVSDGRQTLQGTLAADGFDLGPYISTIRLLASSEREWNHSLISLDGLNAVDLDLRLSAAQLKIPSADLGRTAIVANLRDGKLKLTVGESQAFGGILKGSFDLARSPRAGADLKAQFQFSGVDLDKCLGALFGMGKIEGKGDFAFNVEGSGRSVFAVTESLNGTASLTSEHGAITGVNVEQLLHRLEQRPLSGAGDFRSGRTPYDKLSVNVRLVEGTVNADTARVDSKSLQLDLGGTASIPTRDFDLTGIAKLVPAAGAPADSGFELPFMVRGSWEDPLMLLDTNSLIRRAPAAASLLDAVRDRRARDAVRSAIDHIVGGAPAATAAAKPAAQ
ncbi:AsmA family protein [Bradyrhizobium sp.]|uniref:AsmA family protein n=1 Tax=Bradyrhizobium sp. TaxID=376 RepID=UPI002D336F4D|nr:AsmA family protein [Bradyrhizobium sp.]HZR77028.1 AsmA family protein [Bradyrhizobium sp.]